MRPAYDYPTQRGDELAQEPCVVTTKFRPPRSNTTTVFDRSRALGSLGDYDLVQQLGRCVYVAHHRVTRQAFAIRMLDLAPPGRPDLMQRQLNMARALAAIDHPNVVRTIEVGVHEGRVYLVMEYLRGASLESVLDLRGAPSSAQAIKIGMHVARGLEAAHLRGITHRNLDADTVIVVPTERGRSTIKLVDFEIEPSDDVVRIARHSMSPELVRGGQLDHRTDLYSLGVLLHRLCTLKYPFEGSPIEILAMYRFRSVVRPAPALAGVPPELAATILRCLCEEPADRFRTAAEVVEALRYAAEGSGRNRRAGVVERPQVTMPSDSVPWPDRSAPLALEVDALPTERQRSAGTPTPASLSPAAAPTLLAPPLPAMAPTLMAPPPLAPPPLQHAAVPEPIDAAAESSGILIAPSGPGRVVTALPMDMGRGVPAPARVWRLPWKPAVVLIAAITAGSMLSLWTTGDESPKSGPAAEARPAAAPPSLPAGAAAPLPAVTNCAPSTPALVPDVVLTAADAEPGEPTEVLQVREEPPRKPRRKKPRKPKPPADERAEEPRLDGAPVSGETIVVPEEEPRKPVRDDRIDI